jgi:hypothetical protein
VSLTTTVPKNKPLRNQETDKRLKVCEKKLTEHMSTMAIVENLM